METHARYILIGLFVIVASLAGFGFVYWLHATGGLGERTIYRVRFENTVLRLADGRGGFLQRHPRRRSHQSSVEPWEPGSGIRDDRHRYGNAGPLRHPGADRCAGPHGQSVDRPQRRFAQSACACGIEGRTAVACRRRLRRPRFDAVGSRGARPDRQDSRREFRFASRHDRDFDTFSAALARNSKGIDTILAGLEKTFGGEASKGPLPTFDLTASQIAVAPSKKPAKELVVADPTTSVRNDTQRIIVVASDGQARSWTMRNGPIARRSFFKPKSSRAWKTRISWPGSDAPRMV